MEGINNLGSTCAINSLIQIITRNNELRNIILNSNVAINTFTNELKEIIDLLYNQQKSINPVKFINYFYNTFKDVFNRNEQIDINELWFYFYNKINEETCYNSLNNISLNQITNIEEEHKYKLNIYNENKESEIMKLVQGSYINIIECSKCNNKTYLFEPFITLNLDITNNENISIVDLIVNSMKNEYREKDDWICSKCNEKYAYIKTSRIWKLPKLLFITINRFKEFNKKNNNEIIINNTLNFNKGSIMSENKDIVLNLESIGLHHGDIHGGHYTALCNMKNGNYHLFNDNNINIIKEEELFKDFKSNNAYILLYNNINSS
jgi:ubiquitin C-terminal hydrolase